MRIRTLQLIGTAAFVLSGLLAHAQWECRSHLASNLSPISENLPINLAGEIIGSGGYLTDSYIANGMVFMGAELSFNRLQLYAEGGLKYWYKQDNELNSSFSTSRLGFRELSANYLTDQFKLRLGLQQMQAGDYFLLNERVVGLNLQHESTTWNYQFAAGTVTKDFSRNGIFCSTAYIYDIVPSRAAATGNKWGDTNFASFSFRKERSAKKATPAPAVDADGFEVTDEFESIDTTQPKPHFGLKSYGAIAYAEFGSYYTDAQLYSGVDAELTLASLGSLKAEALFQSVSGNQTLLYYLLWDKEWEWKNGNQTTLQLQYLGAGASEVGASSLPRFSNLFWGEVFRMDAVDLPLVNASLKHQFTDHQLSLKLQYSKQLKDDEMQELDFSVGKFYLKKHLRLTALTGIMNSEQLDNWAKLARLEMRIFF